MTAPYSCPDIKKLMNASALHEQSAQHLNFAVMEESINAEARLRFFRSAVALKFAAIFIESSNDFLEGGWLAALMREIRQGSV